MLVCSAFPVESVFLVVYGRVLPYFLVGKSLQFLIYTTFRTPSSLPIDESHSFPSNSYDIRYDS